MSSRMLSWRPVLSLIIFLSMGIELELLWLKILLSNLEALVSIICLFLKWFSKLTMFFGLSCSTV